MTKQFKQKFESIMGVIEKQIIEGHRENSQVICDAVQQLGIDGLAVRYFFHEAIHNDAMRYIIGAQSFLVYRCDNFYARVNLWYPQVTLPTYMRDEQDKYFSVDLCHNHNFDFFTVGIFGSGYFSNYFSTSQDLTPLSVGDKVNAEKKWDIQLKTGVSMFVPKDTYFHTQHRPKEFSMSLNIMPKNERTSKQYVLEKDQTTVGQIFDVN